MKYPFFYFKFFEGLRLNIANILSVTTNPPTTLNKANPRETEPIIKRGKLLLAVIIRVNAASIVIPDTALAPLIKGVCNVGGTLPISSKPNRLPSNKTQNACAKSISNYYLRFQKLFLEG